MKTKKDIFLEAFELIKNPDTFCQSGDYAINAHGDACSANRDTAVKWCSIGALNHSFNYFDPERLLANEIEVELSDFIPKKYPSLADMNDKSREDTLATWEAFGKSKGWL